MADHDTPPLAGDSAAGDDATPAGETAPAVSRATRAGRVVRHLAGRLRAGLRPGLDGLVPTVRTVRQDLGGAFGHLRRQRHLGAGLIGLVIVLYLLSGTYLVRPGEAAVVTRFGKVTQANVSSGLRWRLPWPIEVARTVNVAQVRREGIGMAVPGHPVELHPPEDIQLLTGDENLLSAKAIVQYRVKNPADYLLRVEYDEDPLLRAVVKAALTELAGGTQVDALLTSGRTEFQQRARDQAQRSLDDYRSGLEVVSIDLQEIVPPGDVAQAFRDVSSAAEEKNKLINDAQGYANSILPQARGEADKRVREGQGYKTDVVNRARGEAQRFGDVLTQYRRDAQVFGSQVTRYRLYIETMETILPKARKYIVEPGKNGEQVNIRILEPMPAAPPAQSARP